ncbi:septal ring lytic transglycosylase RlpA [Aliidiomarina taiwanensis]|uniref:Endolytic peptidoglycan transglycosylase RlpA n=1 Tax=Aliidiomarina taiwanensis TaxID=946228 RepID=A0A432X986_9GAMM|nr:septal ring lytic transglycosylase RlpA family protein [Aliidiomarina taiwanensis]RUO43880.1 septal ring lytic transglycosylase RlpA [Aliidiomarina taiwanensis]
MQKRSLGILVCSLMLVACSNSESRYSMAQDTAPTRTPTPAEILDPVPRYEPYSRQGNRAYSLRGQHYQIIDNVQGYKEQGIASWYGRKFHGHLTSNGEYFDMFSMTAAHKTLPLPIYVKVTNLDNGREAIVRVNDRGPFHPGRIIDLSYAAAYRLGVTETGTAHVEIEVVTPPLAASKEVPHSSTNTAAVEQLYVQVTATSSQENAQQLSQQLAARHQLNATIVERDGLHRVLLGPFSELEAARWLDTLTEAGYSGVFRTQESVNGTEAH